MRAVVGWSHVPAGTSRRRLIPPLATIGLVLGLTPGPAIDSPLNQPAAVAVSNAGTMYIADVANNVVEMVTPEGVLSIFAGTGSAGSPTPGPALESALERPLGLAVDAAGNLYIADAGNNQRHVWQAGAVCGGR